MGITLADMEGVPSITGRIVGAVGSVDRAVEALRGDDAPEAVQFIEKYDSVTPTDRERLKLEEIIVASQLSTRKFVEVLTGALMQQAQDVTKMMVGMAQPRVVEATIRAATEIQPIFDKEGEIVGHTTGDLKAQEMFHKATGFLPMPKGAQIAIQLNNGGRAAEEEDGDEEKCLPPPSMDDYLRQIQEVIRPKELPAPVITSQVPVNAPELEYLDSDV